MYTAFNPSLGTQQYRALLQLDSSYMHSMSSLSLSAAKFGRAHLSSYSALMHVVVCSETLHVNIKLTSVQLLPWELRDAAVHSCLCLATQCLFWQPVEQYLACSHLEHNRSNHLAPGTNQTFTASYQIAAGMFPLANLHTPAAGL